MGTLRSVLLGAMSAASLMAAGVTSASADRAYSWSGFYLGLHLGGAQSDTEWTGSTAGIPVDTVDQRGRSVLGGAQAGYQQQFGNVVAGIEVSWSGMKLDKSEIAPSTERYSSQIDQLVLVTGRLGWAMNRSLIYVKGGWATANYDFSVVHPGVGVHFTSGGWEQGWTAGGGWEYALTPLVSLGVEYNYVKIKTFDQTTTVGTAGCLACTVDDAKSDIQTLMARINVKLK